MPTKDIYNALKAKYQVGAGNRRYTRKLMKEIGSEGTLGATSYNHYYRTIHKLNKQGKYDEAKRYSRIEARRVERGEPRKYTE